MQLEETEIRVLDRTKTLCISSSSSLLMGDGSRNDYT